MNKLLYLYRHNDQVINDAFDRIVVGLHLARQKKGYKSFLLCGCEPGVGTTSIGINLAISMSLSGYNTILVDCDMRKGLQYKRLNEETVIGLSDCLTINAPLSQVTYDTNYDLLRYIPSGVTDKNSINLLCSQKMENVIKVLNEVYDCVIFDFPSANSAVDASIIAEKVDAVVLVAAQGESSKKKIKEARMEMMKAGANVLGIVLNKVEIKDYIKNMIHFDYFRKKKYIVSRVNQESNTKKSMSKIMDKIVSNSANLNYKK